MHRIQLFEYDEGYFRLPRPWRDEIGDSVFELTETELAALRNYFPTQETGIVVSMECLRRRFVFGRRISGDNSEEYVIEQDGKVMLFTVETLRQVLSYIKITECMELAALP